MGHRSCMAISNTDHWKEVAGQIRLKAVWCVIYPYFFGSYLAAAAWRPRDVFYPLPVILWGMFALFSLYAALGYLKQLSWTAIPEEAKLQRAKSRPVVVCILGTAFISFCFALCAMAAKSFGKLCAIGAVVLGICTILMILITDRKIKMLARFFSQPNVESFT
jgi:hypothetical protein